jgi:hypothetical protein
MYTIAQNYNDTFSEAMLGLRKILRSEIDIHTLRRLGKDIQGVFDYVISTKKEI